jgi:hypothetical protein
VRSPVEFTRIGRDRSRGGRAISSTTSPDTADTPATATTRPLYLGTGHDISAAAHALDADQPWSSSAVAESELPDFTPQRRWTSVVLAAAGIVALATLVVAVITMADRSSHPAEEAPPTPTSVVASTTAVSAPSPSPATPEAPPPVQTFSSVTATASTLAPPPPVIPGATEPKPGVRQRLHDLFPRLFPDR